MLTLWFNVKDLKDKAKAGLMAIRDDESGATMIEYSVLIGLLTAALVLAITLVSGYLPVAWQALCTALTGAAC